MISLISGTVEAVLGKSVIVNTGGVGYRIILPEKSHAILSKEGGKVKLFVYPNFNVREGTFDFYGFEKAEELVFFELLMTVSGIGPKSAQSIISNVELTTLQAAIIKGDEQYLRKVSGIGSKTAQRLILELKTKLLEKGVSAGDRDFTSESEAIDALVTLGYSVYHAREALKEVPAKAKTSEEKITEALRILGKTKK